MAAPANILWVLTTQWRAQALGLAGDPNARTPWLDRFARERAVNFTQAVTPHPHGPFARAAILTGCPSPENGVRDYFDPLPTAARTIAHELRNRGYATAFFGKWHLASRDAAAPLVGDAHARMIVPEEARGGFDFWEGFEGGFRLNDPWLHGTRLPEPRPFAGYQSDVVGERATEWLQTQREGRPWFCIVSLEPPHPPYNAPAADVAPPAAETIALPANVPRGGEVEAKARRELAGYYAHIEATDRAIGRLLGATANAWTVVTSVHGDMHGAHGLFRKGWPHEESIRVPLLVSGPTGRGAGTTDLALVSLLDLSRWACAWADMERAAEFDRPRATHQRISMPSVVALPHQCDRGWTGYRTASAKLVLNADGSPWLFHDLARDPGEMENLVNDAKRAEDIARFRAELLAATPPPG